MLPDIEDNSACYSQRRPYSAPFLPDFSRYFFKSSRAALIERRVLDLEHQLFVLAEPEHFLHYACTSGNWFQLVV